MRTKTTTLLLLIATLCSGPAVARSISAQLNVSVEVVARTILTIDSQPSSVEVTEADVARGYVDVPQAIAFRVRSNASSGYSVQFEPLSYPFSRAEVSWGDASATIGTEGTWLRRPYQQGTAVGAMGFRLMLAPETKPGSYVWPISLTADSL